MSVIVHRSASDKLAIESFTRLAFLGSSLVPVKKTELKSVWQGSAEGFQSKICEPVSGKLT